MKTTDLFKTSAKKLNESLAKTFGEKLNLESFDTAKLEDARNKLRTQIHTARTEGGFNENIENEALSKAQFMHDAIVAEIMDRAEHIVYDTVEEAPADVYEMEFMFYGDDGEEGYGTVTYEVVNGQVDPASLKGYCEGDGNNKLNDDWCTEMVQPGGDEHEEALAYAQQDYDEQTAGQAESMSRAAKGYEKYGKQGMQALAKAGRDGAGEKKLDKIRDQHDKYNDNIEERVRDPEEWDEGNTEPANNFAIYINGKKWKVIKGKGEYADDMAERNHLRQLNSMAQQKSEATGKKWTIAVTGDNANEAYDMDQVRKDAADGIKKSIDKQSDDRIAKLKSNKNKGFMAKVGDKIIGGVKGAAKGFMGKESIEQTGDDMRNLREGEIQQASAIVTAKTMVDRVGRWIEELSGMENDTLLTLGDSIRDEMGQEAAKNFISACAPAIQQALENLKSTREALSTSVRALTGEEQSPEMLGAADPGIGMDDEMGDAEPDAMNPDMGEEPAGDDFGAADAATGGSEEMGRMKRESIDRSSRLLKVLAG